MNIESNIWHLLNYEREDVTRLIVFQAGGLVSHVGRQIADRVDNRIMHRVGRRVRTAVER